MTDQEIKDQLQNITQSSWRQLFDLLPEIEQTKNFGELKGGDIQEDGSMEMHYWGPAQIVDRFTEMMYKLGLVTPFDWMNWKKGIVILNDDKADYRRLSTVVLCKLLTSIIRADRFTDGYMKMCFETGKVQKILEVLKNKVLI